jgi:hypothetical protein
MNTVQIYCKLVSLESQYPTNFDVLAIDQLTGYDIPRPYGLVINTEAASSSNNGHWISLYMDKSGKEMFFFDSYGFPYTYFSPQLSNFIHKNAKVLVQNNVQFQSFTSDVCGEHCIYFLNSCIQNVSSKQLHSLYSNNYKENDKVVVQFVKKINLRCNMSNEIRGVCLKESSSYYKMRSINK